LRIKLLERGIDLLMELFEPILPLLLSKIPCLTLDRFACAAVHGAECSPTELQGLAEDGQFSADALQRVRMLFAKSGKRFKIWGELVQQPPQL
jgi:hypothetical protein